MRPASTIGGPLVRSYSAMAQRGGFRFWCSLVFFLVMGALMVDGVDGFVRQRAKDTPLTPAQVDLLAQERTLRQGGAVTAGSDVSEALRRAHAARAQACIDAASAALPGFWHSKDAETRIEAECALREARAETGAP